MAFWGEWGRYVPVAERRAIARREMDKLRKHGKDIQPVTIEGRTIARSFWGKGWCAHLESFADYANRLPRGRTYVRNDSVCHLDIQPQRIDALVSGSELYQVVLRITGLQATPWAAIKKQCAGHIGSLLELLQGRLSDQVMAIVTNRQHGLFPQPGEISFDCSCLDWAVMCKHVAAVLYGVGSRLDSRPELLFRLRDVEAQELITAEVALPAANATTHTLADTQLGAIFGIDLDTATNAPSAPPTPPKQPPRTSRRVGSTATRQPAPAARHRKAAPATRAARRTAQVTGKERRRQQGLSVAPFAAQIGVSSATVYRWEATPGPLSLQTSPLNALVTWQEQAKQRRMGSRRSHS